MDINQHQEDARLKAVEIAFAGVDWEELEASWRQYTLTF